MLEYKISLAFTKVTGYFVQQHPLYIAYDEEEDQKKNRTTPLHKRYAHDIALVQLDTRVDVQSPYTRPICLPSVGDSFFGNDFKKREPGSSLMQDNTVDLFDVERKGQCWVTGWGHTAGRGEKAFSISI